MPTGNYYRIQAQLFAGLALAASDRRIVARYSEMALEQLAKADDVEPGAGQVKPDRPTGNADSDTPK